MSITILDLNDDCIAGIYKYLPIASHLSFAESSKRFYDVWLDYRLYNTIEVGNAIDSDCLDQEIELLQIIRGQVKQLNLNLNRHFNWSDIQLNAIIEFLTTMRALEYVTCWIKDNEPYKIFERIVLALKKLPNIKGLATYQDNYIVDNIYNFNNIEEFLTAAKLNRNPLSEFTNSQTKIYILVFGNGSINATLKGVVQHSTCVKELSFALTKKASEYIPLASLPDLHKLHIFENLDNDYGSLLPLISAVSAKLCRQLHSLTIHAPGIGYAESKAICQMKELNRLDCYFTDCHSLDLLINLKNLTDLFIRIFKYNCSLDVYLLNLLKNCKNLGILQMFVPDFNKNFINEAYEVLKSVRDPNKQVPLTLIFGHNSIKLDEDVGKYLRVFWPTAE